MLDVFLFLVFTFSDKHWQQCTFVAFTFSLPTSEIGVFFQSLRVIQVVLTSTGCENSISEIHFRSCHFSTNTPERGVLQLRQRL